MPNRRVPLWYVLVAMFFSFCVGLGFTFAYVNKIDREWCELLKEMNMAYNTTPPTTVVGQRVATAVQKLYKEKC